MAARGRRLLDCRLGTRSGGYLSRRQSDGDERKIALGIRRSLPKPRPDRGGRADRLGRMDRPVVATANALPLHRRWLRLWLVSAPDWRTGRALRLGLWRADALYRAVARSHRGDDIGREQAGRTDGLPRRPAQSDGRDHRRLRRCIGWEALLSEGQPNWQ